MLIVQNWWALALRGILGIVFGLAAIIWPHIALTTFILIFGAYALLDGVVNLAGAWRRAQHHRPWGAHIFEGVIGVVIGLLAFIWPAMAAVTLVTLIAFWAIVTGILEIVAAVRLRKQITGEWLLALAGVASLLFGIAILAAPLLGALIIATWFGAYAILFGILTTALAFRLRSWTEPASPALGDALPHR
jgi:uncharacterized membrane protein HdeD (DUF308 family)